MGLVFSSGGERQGSGKMTTELLIHLRLHYQILLAPIFFWGFFLAGEPPDLDFWIGVLVFHLFLYGGATAYNSYYDRDEGPIGGLENPPPVSESLLPFSLGVQALGALLALFVNLPFFAVYVVIWLIFTAYSRPWPRLKGRPVGSVVAIGLSQGILASLAGWLSAAPYIENIPLLAWIGFAAAAAIVVGFYPLTQIYQIEEDRERGDQTFAVWAGPRGVFGFALVMQGVAALLLTGLIWRLLDPLNALLVAVFYGLLLAVTVHWSQTYDPARVLANYRRLMWINRVTSLGFLGFILVHLFLI